MKLTLCIILLLCTISFSSADAARVSINNWHDHVELEEWGRKWFEGKRFFIDTENTSYSGVHIVRIITISGNNVIIVFDYNGTNIYLPFNRIRKLYEEK